MVHRLSKHTGQTSEHGPSANTVIHLSSSIACYFPGRPHYTAMRMKVLSIYKSLLRESQQFSSYNFRLDTHVSP